MAAAATLGTGIALDRTVARRTVETGAVAVLAAALAGQALGRRYETRLRDIAAGLKLLGSGETGHRLNPGGPDALGDLERAVNRAAADLGERLAALARDRARLRQVLDGMVEGVLLTDGEGRIVLANGAFERIFGARPPLEGLRPLEAARVPALQEAVSEALRAGSVLTRELVLPGERDKVIRASLAALREAGRTAGAVAVFHDITELKRLEQVRREFVANVSHELRTPLTAIKGFAETLRDGALRDPRQASEFVDVIYRHAERLRALIEDLLDLSAVEQGQSRLTLKAVAIDEVVAQAAAVIRPAADAKGLTLALQIPADLPPARADRDRLAQVLINLLDNAVKFTPRSGRIAVVGARAGERLSLAVSDTGVGIPAGELDRVFERFYRVDRSRDRAEGGTGLGLAIAKHLVLAMRGSIDVESVQGAGTTFTVRLPAA